MYWIEQSREARTADVKATLDELATQSPDRIWLSSDQEGVNAQCVTLIFPVPSEAVMYEFRIQTAQLKAAQRAAYELGQAPGQRLAIIPALLDRMNLVTEESFEITNNHDRAVLVEVVLDVPGLTHDVIERLLLEFVENDYVPPRLRPINPLTLVDRLMAAREQGLSNHYPLF